MAAPNGQCGQRMGQARPFSGSARLALVLTGVVFVRTDGKENLLTSIEIATDRTPPTFRLPRSCVREAQGSCPAPSSDGHVYGGTPTFIG